MQKILIKKLETELNRKIQNQDFEYVSDYTLDGFFQYINFVSRKHPGRKITASMQLKNRKPIIKTFKFNDPGFCESDNDFQRMQSILDDLIPRDKYCIWLTGYFDDTPDTIFQKEKKVYPRAAFGVWIDPNFIPKDDDLIELCKDCGVLALSIEYIPAKLFIDWTDQYDTEEIISYHDALVEQYKRKNMQIEGKDYCFSKPFKLRKETDNPEKGYLATECF